MLSGITRKEIESCAWDGDVGFSCRYGTNFFEEFH
jgi:hypothetical protein